MGTLIFATLFMLMLCVARSAPWSEFSVIGYDSKDLACEDRILEVFN
jgi:hypothetical protein